MLWYSSAPMQQCFNKVLHVLHHLCAIFNRSSINQVLSCSHYSINDLSGATTFHHQSVTREEHCIHRLLAPYSFHSSPWYRCILSTKQPRDPKRVVLEPLRPNILFLAPFLILKQKNIGENWQSHLATHLSSMYIGSKHYPPICWFRFQPESLDDHHYDYIARGLIINPMIPVCSSTFTL